MKRFSCWYEVKQPGSIGEWEHREYVTHEGCAGRDGKPIASVADAMARAFDFFHEIELETGFPVRCNELSGSALAAGMREGVA